MIRNATVVSLLLLTGCVTHEKKIVDTEITRHLSASRPKSSGSCQSSIVKVIDGRIATSMGAVIGLEATLVDAKTVLATELRRAGVNVQESTTLASLVTLKHVNLSQQYESRNISVVVSVDVPGHPAKIIRSSETSVIWVGKAVETEKATAKVFRRTVGLIVDYLNTSCAEIAATK